MGSKTPQEADSFVSSSSAAKELGISEAELLALLESRQMEGFFEPRGSSGIWHIPRYALKARAGATKQSLLRRSLQKLSLASALMGAVVLLGSTIAAVDVVVSRLSGVGDGSLSLVELEFATDGVELSFDKARLAVEQVEEYDVLGEEYLTQSARPLVVTVENQQAEDLLILDIEALVHRDLLVPQCNVMSAGGGPMPAAHNYDLLVPVGSTELETSFPGDNFLVPGGDSNKAALSVTVGPSDVITETTAYIVWFSVRFRTSDGDTLRVGDVVTVNRYRIDVESLASRMEPDDSFGAESTGCLSKNYDSIGMLLAEAGESGRKLLVQQEVIDLRDANLRALELGD